ncbi:hypothetical protein NX059_005814 [Plenodomus lindquistii]|nr:hypothetical protein NX059_005814 [Plenodomus lindquistii]
MLARSSSDAGTRLRRSKSTSTVHRRPPSISEPLDLDAIQQQALAAATTAFARAQGQDAADRKSKRSSDMSRSKSNASRKSLTSQGSHFPPRESSFRSLQPQNTGQTTSTHRRKSRAGTINTEQFPPFYPTPSSERPLSSSRPLSSQASTAFGEKARPRSQSKVHQQSASSSVTSQQIRKARSMYYASSVQTGSPIARPPAKYLTTPPPAENFPHIEPMPALPPIRPSVPSPLAGPRLPVTVAADETVNTARDRYLQSFQHKTVKHKPSVFLAPFKKRQDKGRDKGKRIKTDVISASTSSHKTPDESTTNVTLADFNPLTEPKEKRSFSGSLKSRFKRVFRRTSIRSPTLPVQQIEASRDYSNATGLKAPSPDNTSDIPSPHDDMLLRVRSRTPSYEIPFPAFVRSGSRTSSNGSSRSNRSLHSEMNATHASASRVTSWGTAATDDAMTQRALKRLTVIHEAKDSIGSEAERIASLVPRRKSVPLSALASFRDPMPMDSLAEESFTPVDPKRVFSALMKEIDASKSPQSATGRKDRTPGAESDVFESSATKELHGITRELHSSASRDFRPSTSSDHRPPSRRPASAAAHSVQSKTSTIRSIGRVIKATIRTVSPPEQQHPEFDLDQSGSACGSPGDTGDDSHSSPAITTPNHERREHNTVAGTTDSGSSAVQQQAGPDYPVRTYTPSASQIEQRVERAKARWKTPLDKAETFQFPRETDRSYNVTKFTQQTDAFFAADESLPRSSMASVTKSRSDQDTPKPHAITSPMSPSVYSRDTDGISIIPNGSVLSFDTVDIRERSQDGGSAVVQTSQSVRSYVVGTPSPHRPDSTRTSRDWKAWLSHEISGMESSSQEDLKIHEHFLTPSRKHRRGIVRTSHTEQDGDTTVILRESFDITTPRPEGRVESIGSTSVARGQDSVQIGPDQVPANTHTKLPALEQSESPSVNLKEISQAHTPTENDLSHKMSLSEQPGPAPLAGKERVQSTISRYSRISAPPSDNRHSSMMNERFPYIETGRSSSSNSTRSSRLSKSPSESVASGKSSKATSSPRVYSDLSAPVAQQIPKRASNIALKRSDAIHKRKENVTPPTMRANVQQAPSPLLALAPRPMSLQPLATTVVNERTPNNSQYMSNVPEIKHAKHDSSPAATPLRPRIYATLRPASTHDMSRRPRSAFDLRSPRKYGKTGVPTTMPRPTSILQVDSSTTSLGKEATSIDERMIETTSESRPTSRSGSVTPGQRMADHWLKQRKSTSALENSKMRGGMRLVREDTPAFL